MRQPTLSTGSAGVDRVVTRAEVEEFLYLEADLLDRWRLDDWFALMEEGSEYYVPTTDWTGWGVLDGGFFSSDDYPILQARLKRLKSRKAHAENPRSRTHRMISNVILRERDADLLEIQANFVIHRFRDETVESYVGRYEHLLRVTESGLLMRRRRSVLAHELLTPGARLSFIL
ncbi:MAG: aromatic-ring-hydroxylating dioxygenase subunit beta [Candidatus Nanopelagicales bacterium]|nr:aromatic-ring-hydroxylating dioxygenase subunit beta [Candidatus Nanopelagicales bacterium]MCF8542000.1 aromatic-ring-hydroxylating dioxygenase subunit beta [Candidatus Nanopelagicales bacterium]